MSIREPWPHYGGCSMPIGCHCPVCTPRYIQPHGCICPAGAEKTCQGFNCPRRAPPSATAAGYVSLPAGHSSDPTA